MSSPRRETDIASLVERVLKGDRRAAGQVISLIEHQGPEVEELMRSLYPCAGKAYLVGITGAPGAGKSSLVDELTRVIRSSGSTVAVLAVDPNSPFTGGAILGDRIRMSRHALDKGVYIRSMGARGHLGGLAPSTRNAVVAFDAMGFDYVLLETVGVGQSELEVAEAADTTTVVVTPGQGDGIQAIKAGIMEIADIFVVNKADQPQADKSVSYIRDLLRMDLYPREWTPPIVMTIASQNQGLEDLWMRIQQHRRYLTESGNLEKRRRARLEREIFSIAERRVREQILEPRTETSEFRHLLDMVVKRRMNPYDVAETIVPRQAPGAGK